MIVALAGNAVNFSPALVSTPLFKIPAAPEADNCDQFNAAKLASIVPLVVGSTNTEKSPDLLTIFLVSFRVTVKVPTVEVIMVLVPCTRLTGLPTIVAELEATVPDIPLWRVNVNVP